MGDAKLPRLWCPRDDTPRVIADARTVAESCTSTGRHFRVSMGLAPPPTWSYLYHAMVDTSAPSASAIENDGDTAMVTSAPASAVENDDDTAFSDISRSPPTRPGSPKVSDFSKIVTAHDDSVLFHMTTDDGAADYFVYTAGVGGGASQPRG